MQNMKNHFGYYKFRLNFSIFINITIQNIPSFCLLRAPFPKLLLAIGRFHPRQLLHKLSGSELQLHNESSSKRSESSKLNRSHSSALHSAWTTSGACACSTAGACCCCWLFCWEVIPLFILYIRRNKKWFDVQNESIFALFFQLHCFCFSNISDLKIASHHFLCFVLFIFFYFFLWFLFFFFNFRLFLLCNMLKIAIFQWNFIKFSDDILICTKIQMIQLIFTSFYYTLLWDFFLLLF